MKIFLNRSFKFSGKIFECLNYGDQLEDKRNILKDKKPFDYKFTKEGKTLIFWNGKQVSVIKGKKCEELKVLIKDGDEFSIQLLLAKITGHFKHGNER